MKRGKYENVNGRAFRNADKKDEISSEEKQESSPSHWNASEDGKISPAEYSLPNWIVSEEGEISSEQKQEDFLPHRMASEEGGISPEQKQEKTVPPRYASRKAESSPAKKQEKPLDPRKNALLYLHDIVYLMAGLILVLLLLFRVAVVSGTSMNDTLVDGDYLLVLGSVFYTNPKQGDIIVASKASFDNGTPIVKRVIATEGQTVDIDFDAGIVYVDDVALDEPYITTLTTQAEGVVFPLTVEEGCVFVMGDNRYISKDSRSPEIGLIDTREILGKAILLFFPGTDKGTTQRQFDRIGALT